MLQVFLFLPLRWLQGQRRGRPDTRGNLLFLPRTGLSLKVSTIRIPQSWFEPFVIGRRQMMSHDVFFCQTPLDRQELLCGQLAGVARCVSELSLSPVRMLRLRRNKFAVRMKDNFFWVSEGGPALQQSGPRSYPSCWFRNVFSDRHWAARWRSPTSVCVSCWISS